MEVEADLLAIEHGSVTAPAGCGKTQLIAEAIARHTGPKPILVLTHTNAGVMALRTRLDRVRVPASAYKLATLDGWAMRLTANFPARSGLDPCHLKLREPARDYLAIRQSAAILLSKGHLQDVLAASYDRLLVDEYQDCLKIQHALVGFASEVLPACVRGDPLQAIFGFAGKLADWEADVRPFFPHATQLSTPWRWVNAGERAFGQWLLEVRASLLAGLPVDLRSAPHNVEWVPLDGAEDRARRLAACSVRSPTEGGGVLIIAAGKDKFGQRRYAMDTPGAVTVESVDLADLVTFADGFDPASPGALRRICDFADDTISGADAAGLPRRVAVLRPGAGTPSTETEAAALSFRENDHRGRDWRGNPIPDQCRFQIYLWDQISYEHLCRVVGRHLKALLQNDELRNLAWLFPAEESLTNPEHASRASAITIVENVVRASLAAPIPHHYALMGVARVYHPARIENPGAMFRVHPAAAAPEAAEFWGKTIGIVTPHRAQQGLVVGILVRLFRPLGHEPDLIRKGVDTVERFQGQKRDVMLASYAVDDPDTVGDEEEFLHSLNRFNVMVSRARAKLLVIFTEQLVGHLSDDIAIIRQSAMLKHFAETHCGSRAVLELPWLRPDGSTEEKEASFRWA